jgi:hypothetical protein
MFNCGVPEEKRKYAITTPIEWYSVFSVFFVMKTQNAKDNMCFHPKIKPVKIKSGSFCSSDLCEKSSGNISAHEAYSCKY